MSRPPTSGTNRNVRASATSSSLPWIPPSHLFLRSQRLTPWFIVVPVASCSNAFHMASTTVSTVRGLLSSHACTRRAIQGGGVRALMVNTRVNPPVRPAAPVTSPWSECGRPSGYAPRSLISGTPCCMLHFGVEWESVWYPHVLGRKFGEEIDAACDVIPATLVPAGFKRGGGIRNSSYSLTR
ncbi:protein of unknown function [Candidatus Methylomirabilis oxygeniifera]|uniref:Uncharacterized protein n=1 Tax=Methylomirabilis oxygeniifera TaxID=671143 RepID=D5MLD7_METO1|nr:protein of unknown function [Candidatus Methylomirabilis oxyfera]